MKSAIQELIEWLNNQMALAPKEMLPSERGLYNGYLNTKNKAERLLEKEKQQIIDDFDNGQANHDPKCQDYKNGLEYYNQTYNQK